MGVWTRVRQNMIRFESQRSNHYAKTPWLTAQFDNDNNIALGYDLIVHCTWPQHRTSKGHRHHLHGFFTPSLIFSKFQKQIF